ncbi:hypothetical protein ACCO45_007692 [Purpureocillium lilacinum]|uniref:Uncharacterized protein n=1 Tax=Purpureocillium lilacinum TaxID=33203 RepID=A0ACC4DMM0_PURLI
MPFLVAAEYQWADVQTALLLQMIKCSTPVIGLRHRIKLPALGRMYVVTSVVYDPIVPVRAGTPGSPDDLSNLTSEVDKGANPAQRDKTGMSRCLQLHTPQARRGVLRPAAVAFFGGAARAAGSQ